MAAVPQEAIEFVRVLVRAFYRNSFAVIIDGVLDHSNYVSHDDLSRSLHLNPKELRRLLNKMTFARLVKSEKRQQKRINYKDERAPTRTVLTEFWYVPFVELLDAFQYRLDVIDQELDRELKSDDLNEQYVCSRCHTKYTLLEISGNTLSDKGFICNRVDLRRECGGLIVEEDNTEKAHQTESFKGQFNEQLRPLRVLAAGCIKAKIPAHPLEGVDEKRWGELVPETVGMDGVPVNEEGLAVENNKPKEQEVVYDIKIAADEQDTEIAARAGQSKPDEVIPERPEWFKEEGKEEDDDWDEAAKVEVPADAMQNDSAKLHEQEGDAYYQKFLAENMAQVADAPGEASRAAANNTASPRVNLADLEVKVGGVSHKLEDITEELTERMTAEEYQDYYTKQIAASGGGGEGDSDEDMDFE